MSNNSDISPAPARTLTGIALVAAVIGGIYFFAPGVFGVFGKSDSAVEKENQELRAQLKELKAKQDELDAEQLMEIESQQLSLGQLIDLDAQGKVAEKELAALEEQQKLWLERTSDLATSDTGRQIAAHNETLKQYQALMQRKLPSPELSSAAKAKLAGVLMPVREALKNENPLFVPSAATANTIALVTEESFVAAKEYREANQVLDELVHSVADKDEYSQRRWPNHSKV